MEDTPIRLVENSEEIPRSPRESGSVPPDNGLAPSNQDPQSRRSERGKVPRHRFQIEGESFMVCSHDDAEPKNFKEAMTSPKREKWIIAQKEEIESMRINGVWQYVDLPEGRKAIGNKRIFKVKRNADGLDEIYRARLVAKVYTQQEGVDYEETFSLW